MTAMASVAASSQSRIEFRVREDSMNRRQFISSAFALGVGKYAHASGYGATAFGGLGRARPARLSPLRRR